MALELLPKGYIASEALTTMRFVKLNATDNEKVDQADAQGERVLGVGTSDVSADEATDGKTVTVILLGETWVEAGGAITAGARITTGATGKAEAAATGDFVVGRALSAAAADGDLIRAFIDPDLGDAIA